MPKVGILYNDIKPTACRIAGEIRDRLRDRGCEVLLTSSYGGILGFSKPGSPRCHTPIEHLAPPEFDETIDFGIVFGGDGTVLAAFRQVAPLGIPLLGVNTGHMGFLTETYVNQLSEAIEKAIAGEYETEERTMLTVKILRDETLLWEALCLNEIVVHREPLTSMCHFEIQIGHHAPIDIAADGVIVSTPTGSTAYSLSAGGPVVAPGIPALQLIPICPHSLASRALVFSNREIVTIFPANPTPMVMVVDGNGGCAILPQDRIQIEKSQYSAKFIRLQSPEFFRILREKLGWGLPHIAKPTSVELP
ncbi:MAG: NAD(+) kinase [Cyanobacteria bacterium SBLK]|nr:NAD(+) kinase [Cyanobacteria bacterium SBLK]